MGEDRRAVIETALRSALLADGRPKWVEIASGLVERAVAEWERSREPTEDEAEDALRFFFDQEDGFTGTQWFQMGEALRAARDVRENTDE
jgi:hypothetical protein